MDQMSVMLMLDDETSKATDFMAPHKNILDPNEPRALTSNASIPKPVSSTIANYLSNRDIRPQTKEQSDFLNSLAI